MIHITLDYLPGYQILSRAERRSKRRETGQIRDSTWIHPTAPGPHRFHPIHSGGIREFIKTKDVAVGLVVEKVQGSPPEHQQASYHMLQILRILIILTSMGDFPW